MLTNGGTGATICEYAHPTPGSVHAWAAVDAEVGGFDADSYVPSAGKLVSRKVVVADGLSCAPQGTPGALPPQVSWGRHRDPRHLHCDTPFVRALTKLWDASGRPDRLTPTKASIATSVSAEPVTLRN